jgi:hypothetical protein
MMVIYTMFNQRSYFFSLRTVMYSHVRDAVTVMHISSICGNEMDLEPEKQNTNGKNSLFLLSPTFTRNPNTAEQRFMILTVKR